MYKFIKNQKHLTTSFPKRLQYTDLRFSSNYYGALNKFKFTDHDLKTLTPIQSFIDKYRKHGHHYSRVDPLELAEKKSFPTLSDFKLDQKSSLDGAIDSNSYINKLKLKDLKQLEEFLTKTYTKNVGVEFDHVSNTEEREWLYNQYEEVMNKPLSKDEKNKILKLLVEGEALDLFLTRKFQTFKRYSGEGVESLLVALNTVFADAADAGVTDIVLAMPHRGRFNVLVELLDYPSQDLFYKISGKNDTPEEFYTSIDDVPSHIAASTRKTFSKGTSGGSSEVNVTMLHNPSHLEAVNPVGMGKTRAKQDDKKDTDKIFNIQLHGDAAFAGQGVIYESFALSKTPAFNIHGAIHIICNNQLGFTTLPTDGRSTEYSSDIVKTYDVPVIHVNADHPEDVFRVAMFAVKYRQQFKKDIMIDLIGYRKYGHNELDEPGFTQPLMYKQIREAQVPAPKKYHQALVSEGIVSEQDLETIRSSKIKEFESNFNSISSVNKTLDLVTSESYKGNRAFTGKWKNCTFSVFGKEENTGFDANSLRNFAKASVQTPSSFEVHQRIQKHHVQPRLAQNEKNSVDWATAEAVAFASLLQEGYNIRFTGQDVQRGTFSHRHLTFVDSQTEKKFYPLNNASEGYTPKGKMNLSNSPLSEIGVLSYEYGYSIESPNNLVLWEAQFGDFFNTAQVAVDTFITCSEAKWMRQSGLVVLLPHGMDGAGPEHSSCRIERFLQMGATDGIYRNLTLNEHDSRRKRSEVTDEVFYENHQDVNFQFATPTTPANYFHLLRRQVKRNFRKPLVLSVSKILLKHPNARSKFEDMDVNTEFNPLYVFQGDKNNLATVDTVIFCTGRIHHDIRTVLNKKPESYEKTAVFAIEELLPFPEHIIKEKLSQVKKSAKVVWFQEETMNNGAFWFAEPRLARILRELDFESQNIKCHARRAVASIAHGIVSLHHAEQLKLAQCLDQYL